MTHDHLDAPYFSLIVPTYNRARFVARTLNSCLQQSDGDFEVIVVDDGSSDDTARVLQELTDPRIIKLRHPINRGVGPARNTAMAAARGQWLACLDSDDELLPGALGAMRTELDSAGPEISGARFMCRFENGDTSPVPALAGETWNYEAFVKWAERSLDGRQESLPCVRRETFAAVRYPDDRNLESLYHFDFAKQFLMTAGVIKDG